MILYWAAILVISTLLYVLLDGFDLGVGILTAAVRSDARREAMMSAIEPT
jgi:cytochrome bd ubiquinol oxidase subunit II